MATTGKLADKFAIVTGGGRGLGRAIAEHFVRAGAGVFLTGRDGVVLDETVAHLKSLGGQVIHSLVGDVASPESCHGIVAQALKIAGRMDILVNNAAVCGPMGPLEEIDWQEFVDTIQINLFGTVMMCREVIGPMRKQGKGKIVNLSGGGATTPLPRINAYAASKAAVVRLTENLAEELRGAHIDVNAIAPGALNTRMLDQVLEAGPQAVGKNYYDKAIRQRDEGGASPDKAAELAVFLASTDSDGITGRLISAVWDNWTDLARHRDKLAKSDIYTLRRIIPEDRGDKW